MGESLGLDSSHESTSFVGRPRGSCSVRLLKKARDYAFADGRNTQGIVVVRGGVIVAEWYADGSDAQSPATTGRSARALLDSDVIQITFQDGTELSFAADRDVAQTPGTTFNFARFGLLYARGGVWRDRTLISRTWIQQSVAPSSARAGYGYQWWLLGKQDQEGAAGGLFFHIPPEGLSSTLGTVGPNSWRHDEFMHLVLAALH